MRHLRELQTASAPLHGILRSEIFVSLDLFLQRVLFDALTVDLGQGILRVMEEEHKAEHPELTSEGGYLVPTAE